MDDNLGLDALDDPMPPTFDDAGAAAARSAAVRRARLAGGGAALATLCALVFSVALVASRGEEPAETLLPATGVSTTIPLIPGGPAIPVPSIDPTLPTIAPSIPPTTGTTVSKADPPRPTATTSSPAPPPTSTPGPAKGAPPRGDVPPPDGVVFSLIVGTRTLRWDEEQRVTARLVNNSSKDLHIQSGCGVTHASVYDMTGLDANTYASGGPPPCDETTGYFGPAVVRPGETREAVVTLVARGPDSPKGASGSQGVRPGRYNAYGSWALDSGRAGKIDYMHSQPVPVDVVGR